MSTKKMVLSGICKCVLNVDSTFEPVYVVSAILQSDSKLAPLSAKHKERERNDELISTGSRENIDESRAYTSIFE